MNSKHVEVLRDMRDYFTRMGGDAADIAALDYATTATKALEYVFGSYTDWERVVEEELTPPWPLVHHAKAMGLLKDKPPAEAQGDAFCDGHCTWLDHAPGCPVEVEELAKRIETYHWDAADKAVAAKFAAELRSLAQQPASDGGFTAADMMDARQEGRQEAATGVFACGYGPARRLRQ